MMRQHFPSFLLVAVAALVAVILNASLAQAGFLAQLESVQSNNGVLRQYKFEGGTTAQQRSDTGSAHVNLLPLVGEGGTMISDPDMVPMSGDETVVWTYPHGDASMIGFEPGFDGAGGSQAFRPQSLPVTSADAAESLAQRRSGAAFYTPFTTPTMMTVEAVLKPDAYTDTGLGPHYVFQTRPGTGRGYYLSQLPPVGSRNTNGQLTTIVGSNFSERPSVLPDYSDQSHWYYVVATFDLSGTNAIVSASYADLTAGGPLTSSQTAYNFAATIGAGLVGTAGNAGVGAFSRNTDLDMDGINDGQEFFYGSIDNLAIYDKKLTPDQIALHHRALTVPGVPEPASFLLLGCGGFALGLLRRRA